MHMHFLDPYHPTGSPIQTLDGRVKLVLTLVFILTTSLTPVAAWPVYILLFAAVLSTEIMSGLGVLYILKARHVGHPLRPGSLTNDFHTWEDSAVLYAFGHLDIGDPRRRIGPLRHHGAQILALGAGGYPAGILNSLP